MAANAGMKITYRAYAGYPGRIDLIRGRKMAPEIAASPNIQLPRFSAKIILVEVAAMFRPEQEKALEETLGSRDLLAEIQTNFLNVGKVAGPEIRVIYIGGHLDACLDSQLNALPVLAHFGKRVEALLPLDLIYLGPEDFKPELQREAFNAKAEYLIGRTDGLHRKLNAMPQVDYAIFFDDELIEARGEEAAELPNPLVVRIFSSTEKMLAYLHNAQRA